MSAANDQISDARNRMLGSVPGTPALGRGPAPDGGFSRHEYDHPAAGWGAARSVGHVLSVAPRLRPEQSTCSASCPRRGR